MACGPELGRGTTQCAHKTVRCSKAGPLERAWRSSVLGPGGTREGDPQHQAMALPAPHGLLQYLPTLPVFSIPIQPHGSALLRPTALRPPAPAPAWPSLLVSCTVEGPPWTGPELTAHTGPLGPLTAPDSSPRSLTREASSHHLHNCCRRRDSRSLLKYLLLLLSLFKLLKYLFQTEASPRDLKQKTGGTAMRGRSREGTRSGNKATLSEMPPGQCRGGAEPAFCSRCCLQGEVGRSEGCERHAQPRRAFLLAWNQDRERCRRSRSDCDSRLFRRILCDPKPSPFLRVPPPIH